MKKILSIIMALAMVLTMASFPAFAEGEAVKIEGLSASNVTFSGHIAIAADRTNLDTLFDGNVAGTANTANPIDGLMFGWCGSTQKKYIEITLNEITNIKELKLYWGGGEWNCQPAQTYNIYFAGGDGVYGAVAHTYTATETGSQNGKKRDDVITLGVPAQDVKKVKIEVTATFAGGQLYLRELELYEVTGEVVLTPATYTVKYVDEQGKEIADAKVVTEGCYKDSIVTEEAAKVSGYKPIEPSKTVTLVAGENTITFVYKAVSDASYTVKYVDEAGNEIAAAKKVTGVYETDEITEIATNLFSNGYFVAENKKTVTLDAGDENEIIFAYKKVIKATSVSFVSYHDDPENDKKYHYGGGGDGTINNVTNGWIGKNANNFNTGTYTFDTNQGMAAPVFDIVFDFDKAYAFDTITMYWSNSDSNVDVYVSDDKENWGEPVYSGTTPGVSVNTSASNVKATELELADGAEGQYVMIRFNKGLYTSFHEIIFQEAGPDKEPVGYIVNYVDAQGKVLSPAKSGTGYVGDLVTEKSVKIGGYTADKTTKTITLDADETKNVITFTYTEFTGEYEDPYRVKIFTIGDSFTEGVIEPNAYRYYIYENLIQAGGVFEFIGPFTSQDWRVTDMYEKHGGVGGHLIGYKDDFKSNGSSWVTNGWSVTTESGKTIESASGTFNSVLYQLTAGKYGTTDYTKTMYGNYVAEADIVTLYIGLNDYYGGRSVDLEFVKDSYRNLVNRIYEINPNVSLYVVTLNEVGGLRGYDTSNASADDKANSVYKFNEWLLTGLVNEEAYKNYKLQAISLNQDGYKMNGTTDVPSDDSHPNENGNRKIGTQIYMGIKDEVLELNAMGSEVEYNPTKVTGITIDKTSATLKVGENLTIGATLTPANPEIITTIFSSSNEAVATVDGYGRVTAVGAGTATIYATALDSMRPGDTEIKAACTVTVTSDKYANVGDDYPIIFMEKFDKKEQWTGKTDYIKTGGFAYKHSHLDDVASSSITSVEKIKLDDRFSMAFNVAMFAAENKTASDRNSYYTSLKVGKYELRVAVNGRVVEFYYNGAKKGEKVFNAPVSWQNTDRYTLTRDEDTVYVYRNNELLFTVVGQYENVEDNLVLTCKGDMTHNVRNIEVKGTYGLIRLNPTVIKSATSNYPASNMLDGLPNTRYSVILWKDAVPSEWTDSSKNEVILDLGAEYDVTNLNIFWGSPGGNSWGSCMVDTYNVSYSADNKTYTPALAYQDIASILTGSKTDTYSDANTEFLATYKSGAKGNNRITLSYGSVKESELGWKGVRYIKIQMTKVSHNPTISELEVFTTEYIKEKEPDITTAVSPMGASIRFESDNYGAGLRFAAEVDKEKAGITEENYSYNTADVKFGMFLLPKDMLGSNASLAAYLENGVQKALEIPAKYIFSQEGNVITYTAVLTGIPESGYNRTIVAVPYVIKDGSYVYYNEIERNYFNVAKDARATTYSDAEIAKITDEAAKAKMQAVADELDKIINSVEINSVEKTKVVVPAKSAVYAMGRTYNYNELLHAGAVYEYKCTGSVVGANITKAAGDPVRFEVSIDGGDFVSYTTSDTKTNEYIFANGLDSSKEHTVRIQRATDIWGPKMTVNSVVVSKNANVVANYSPDYDLKIEFVGDSITSGTKTDTYAQSYVYLTAKALNANYNVVSRSGLGLHQNANNGSGGQLPSVYASVASGDGNYKYDYDPDLVVLNIGTNDGANVNKLDTDGKAEYRAAFKEKYVDMLETIHEKNPNATILCTGGLMGDFGSVKTQITEAVELFKADNPDAKVYCEFLSVAKDISADTSWHPGIAGHAKGAEELIPIIKEIMNIK